MANPLGAGVSTTRSAKQGEATGVAQPAFLLGHQTGIIQAHAVSRLRGDHIRRTEGALVNPALLLLLLGGGLAAMSARSTRSKKGKLISPKCERQANGTLLFEIGPLRLRLPKNVSILVLDMQVGDSKTLVECGLQRSYPTRMAAWWTEPLDGDFSRTRSVILGAIDFANIDPDMALEFIITVNPDKYKPAQGILGQATLEGYSANIEGEPGALWDDGWFQIVMGQEISEDDPFTAFQYMFGRLKAAEEAYQPEGNGVLWVGDDSGSAPARNCDGYIEAMLGKGFLPVGGSVSAMEAPTLEQTLAMPGNSAWGYVDWLLNNDPILESLVAIENVEAISELIAQKILRESGIPCDLSRHPSNDWPEGARWFFEWLNEVIKPWVSDHLGGVHFG